MAGSGGSGPPPGRPGEAELEGGLPSSLPLPFLQADNKALLVLSETGQLIRFVPRVRTEELERRLQIVRVAVE